MHDIKIPAALPGNTGGYLSHKLLNEEVMLIFLDPSQQGDKRWHVYPGGEDTREASTQ